MTDPECQIQTEGHRCAGRGGKEITATNGAQCFKNAEAQANRTTEPVVDLIGRNVAGQLAQVRNPDYLPECPPMWRRLIRVERRMQKTVEQLPKEPWVYWFWQREGDLREDCGYSGMTVAEARLVNRCLEFQS